MKEISWRLVVNGLIVILIGVVLKDKIIAWAGWIVFILGLNWKDK